MVKHDHGRNKVNRQHNRTITETIDEQSDRDTRTSIESLTGRLLEAGLHTDRFIDVADGQKQSYDHTQFQPESIDGNYGVYCGDGLVGVDIDDYKNGADTSALVELPPTFTVETPHGGKHRYYKGDGAVTATVRSATGGSESTTLSWGELYAGGKYLVGPGCSIETCDKNGCHVCRYGDATYSIIEDREIAELSSKQILRILEADPEFSGTTTQPPVDWYGDGFGGRGGENR